MCFQTLPTCSDPRYTQRMKRFLVVLVLVAVVFNRQFAFGTLIIVVPANGGVVIAADTRSVFMNTECETETKILRPHKRSTVAVLISGTPVVLKLPAKDAKHPCEYVTPKHPCQYLKSAPKIMDLVQVILSRLDAKPTNTVLSEEEVSAIAKDTFAAVQTFDDNHRKCHPLNFYLGIGVQVDFVSYDAKHATVLIGGFAIPVNEDGKAELWNNTKFSQLSMQMPLGVMVNGDKEFASAYVHTAELQAILQKPIGDVSIAVASSAALKYISDAEKAAEVVKEEHAEIGGPIDVATITRTGIQIKREPGNR
jgi:hypothetical protein